MHNRCAHIHYENSDKDKFRKVGRKTFSLPKKKMLAPTKVAWDEEMQEDVVLKPKGSKKLLKKAIEKDSKITCIIF